MTSWRFYPLAEHLAEGILVTNGKQPVAAHFLTPERAKLLAPRKLTDQRKADAA